MNAGELIASGLIEAYVLGAASAEEQREVELMAARYPEVAEALQQAREDLEAYAELHSKDPGPEMRERIMNAVNAGTEEKGRIIPLQRPSAFAFSRTAAAAIIIILLGSVSINLYLFNSVRKAEAQNTAALDQVTTLRDSMRSSREAQQVLQARFDTMSLSYKNSMAALRELKNPSTIVMNSVKQDAPSAKAVVYWCSATHLVCIDPMTLPGSMEAGKEYQLWAIVGGKPVSVGVFEGSDAPELKMMRVVPEAEAFAVTLEKKGGVPSPEGPMYVMGKI